MPDIVDPVEVPPHNRECGQCLENGLKLQALKKAAQTLAGADHMLQGGIDRVSKKQHELEKRIDTLDDTVKEVRTTAQAAATVSGWWWKAVSVLSAIIAAGAVWWMKNVQDHIDKFGK